MQQRILVIGGSGFIGSRLVNRLSLSNQFVTVPTRRRQRARHLVSLPLVDVVEADVHDDADLDRLVAGMDAVVNLVGILHGRPADFDRCHAQLPRRIAAACARHGVRRLVHMSALGADAGGPSMYLRSKAAGEAAVQAQPGLHWTIFRPSVVFGEGDRFLTTFARLQRLLPLLPLPGAGTRMAPVWVGDVAQAFHAALIGARARDTFGRTYALCGPRVYTLGELARLAGAIAGVAGGRGRPVLPVPLALGRLQAALLALAPGEPMMSADNLDSLKVDNVCDGSLPGFAPELGVNLPESIEAIGPTYLDPRGAESPYNRVRAGIGR